MGIPAQHPRKHKATTSPPAAALALSSVSSRPEIGETTHLDSVTMWVTRHYNTILAPQRLLTGVPLYASRAHGAAQLAGSFEFHASAPPGDSQYASSRSFMRALTSGTWSAVV